MHTIRPQLNARSLKVPLGFITDWLIFTIDYNGI